MADGSVIIKVEMDTGGVQAGVDDIKAGCGRAAAAAERAGKAMTGAMSDGTRSMAAWGESARRAGALVQSSCGMVRDGMGAMAAQNGVARGALDGLSASLGAVRLSLAGAFAPVATAAAPLLGRLCELVARAADYVARFFAVLRGKSTYKKAVTAQNAITKSVAGTGAAAKEAARNLSGLDELNIWKENKDSGGGGYGGVIGGGAGVDMQEVEAGQASDFVVRLRDILFKWDDMSPELIAEKILTGLCAVAGGIIGYSLGGPVGGLVGLTLGALLGVKLSQLTFNGDGKLDKAEIIKLILMALGGLIGGVLGYAIGGPKGAAIGFLVGASISVALSNAVIEKGTKLKKWISKHIWKPIKKGIKSFGDAVVEFAVGVRNDAPAWWTNVKNWWSGKVGDVKPFSTSVTNSASSWWSSVKSWWGGKVGPVQPFTTSVTNNVSGWWSSVKSWWGGKVGAVQPFTTSVTNNASGWWSSVKSWWGGKVGAVQPFTTSVTNNASGWWKSVNDWWGGKVGYVASFKTAVVNNASGWWKSVNDWWGGKVGYVRSFATSVINNASAWWANVKDWWKSKSKEGTSFSVTAKATSFVDAIKDKTITVKAKISEIVSSAASKVKSWLGLATGGIYKNGRWEPIAGYAAGGSPRSARLFYANENGMPELVGRIGSSTAVMNNGQIVASVAAGVYRAVAAAFGRLGGWFSAMTARLGDIPPAIEMLAAMPRQIPQPVMATGTVLPPRAVYADGPVQGLADAVSGLRDALDRRSPDRSGTGREPTYNVNLNVDGQTLCRIVLREGRLRQLQSGGNPFMDLMGG